MTWKALPWAVVAAVITISPGLACKGKTVLFEDNFAKADRGWDVWEGVKIGDGTLRLKTEPGRNTGTFYHGDIYDKADICVDLTIPNLKDPTQPAAGLMFAANERGYYYFWVSPLGTAGVARYSEKNWLNPVQSRKVDGMNTAAGAKNTLRLTLDAARATIYVNDEKIVDFPVNAADEGFIGLSAKGGAGEWAFSNLKITDLPQ